MITFIKSNGTSGLARLTSIFERLESAERNVSAALGQERQCKTEAADAYKACFGERLFGDLFADCETRNQRSRDRFISWRHAVARLSSAVLAIFAYRQELSDSLFEAQRFCQQGKPIPAKPEANHNGEGDSAVPWQALCYRNNYSALSALVLDAWLTFDRAQHYEAPVNWVDQLDNYAKYWQRTLSVYPTLAEVPEDERRVVVHWLAHAMCSKWETSARLPDCKDADLCKRAMERLEGLGWHFHNKRPETLSIDPKNAQPEIFMKNVPAWRRWLASLKRRNR